jgi:hypothetical protein
MARPPAAGATSFSWFHAVDGSASDPTKWTPSGIPAAADHVTFGVSGTYAVTFDSGVANTNHDSYTNGTVTAHVTSPHTTAGVDVGGAFGTSLTIDQGTMNAGFLTLGVSGSYATMTLTGGAVFNSSSQINAAGSGDQIGNDGTSELDVLGGAQYYSSNQNTTRLVLGTLSSAATTMYVAGSIGTFPRTYSGIHTTNGAQMTVGESGVANLIANNGGYVDVTGPMFIGRLPGSQGYVTSGPVSTFGTSSIHVHRNLEIADNGAGPVAGHGEMTVRDRSFVQIDSLTTIGDVNGDAGAVLHVLTGGLFLAAGGLTVRPTSGLGLDLKGGITRVYGGTFQWPANRALTVSSTVGNPELTIADGASDNAGPSTASNTDQLYVGRSGQGTLRLIGPLTLITLGNGATVIGDSTGGSGTMIADSAVWVANTGPITVGNRGAGTLNVTGGSRMFANSVQIAAAVGSTGFVLVKDAGSQLNTVDEIDVGGSGSGPGGNGTLTVDGGNVSITASSLAARARREALAPPPTLYVYAGTGTFNISNSGLLSCANVEDQGLITLGGCNIEGATNVAATGSLRGFGYISNALTNSGTVAPAGATNAFGAITMSGDFLQTSSGHYRVVLGATASKKCDSLVVGGAATLAGTLDLVEDPSFASAAGDTLTILMCGSRSGTFNTVTWNGQALTGQVQVLYQPGAVRLIMNGTTAVDPAPSIEAVRFAAAGSVSSPTFLLDLPETAHVRITLFDVMGREVAELFDGMLPAGEHRIGPDSGSRGRPSGTYFARAVIRARTTRIERMARALLLR